MSDPVTDWGAIRKLLLLPREHKYAVETGNASTAFWLWGPETPVQRALRVFAEPCEKPRRLPMSWVSIRSRDKPIRQAMEPDAVRFLPRGMFVR